jgi:hypothetical protein
VSFFTSRKFLFKCFCHREELLRFSQKLCALCLHRAAGTRVAKALLSILRLKTQTRREGHGARVIDDMKLRNFLVFGDFDDFTTLVVTAIGADGVR